LEFLGKVKVKKIKSKNKSKVKGVGQECPTHTGVAASASVAEIPAFVCD
jgi:hypothetical protein